MRSILKVALLVAAGLVPASAAGAVDLSSYTWKAFGGDGDSASLMVLAKSEVDNPDAHYAFFLNCTAVDQWMMNVSDIDAKALGTAIADGKEPTFDLVVDDKTNEGESGYFPDIVYNQTDRVWEYSTNWDLGLLDDLSKAGKIAIRGTGIDVTLPTDGMTEALQEFKGSCEALQATDEGEGPDNEDAPPPDDMPPDSGQ
jgi:hypothetical protein